MKFIYQEMTTIIHGSNTINCYKVKKENTVHIVDSVFVARCATPFADKDSVAEIFTDLTVWMGIMKVLEQINANAAT